jgi:hypothetical protein
MLALAALMMAQVATARVNLLMATDVAHSEGRVPPIVPPLVVPGVSPAPTLLDYFDSSGTPTTDTQAWGNSIHCDPADLHRVYFHDDVTSNFTCYLLLDKPRCSVHTT